MIWSRDWVLLTTISRPVCLSPRIRHPSIYERLRQFWYHLKSLRINIEDRVREAPKVSIGEIAEPGRTVSKSGCPIFPRVHQWQLSPNGKPNVAEIRLRRFSDLDGVLDERA